MTTLTSHTIPLISLQLNMSPMDTSDAMADGRAIHKHLLTEHQNSGRIQADALRLQTPKEEQASPISRCDSEHSYNNQPICDMDRGNMRRILGHDDMSDARSSSVSSYVADSFNKEHDDDQISYCSDDSELSVGKEVGNEPSYDKHDDNNRRRAEDMESESADGVYRMQSNEIAVGIDSLRYSNKFPNLIRPSPTRIQEEFLRKSQLYADELMKHQINFMAATRNLNISPKAAENPFGYPIRSDNLSPIRSPDDHRNGFRPHLRISADLEQKWSHIEDRSTQSPDGTCFRGIHSHLNAISKITSALGRDITTLSSPSGMTSRESSQSPPSNLHQIMNNNLNEPNLKFSIENILKPSFGGSRRITDPLLKRKTVRKPNQKNVSQETNKKSAAIDLTACPTLLPPTSPASSVSEQEKLPATNNATKSSSGGPMVWPAWVYCTRYSDRPSSGRILYTFYILPLSYHNHYIWVCH